MSQKGEMDTTVYYGHMRQEMLEFIPPRSQRLLDVGCGSGTFISEVKKVAPVECWGVELNQEAAERAKQVADQVFSGDIHLHLDKLPEKFFDCIFFNDVLEHIQEPFLLLEAMRGKLSRNGVIVASILNVRYIKNLVELLLQKDWQYRDAGILDWTHLRFFTKKSMTRSLLSMNWQILSCKGIQPTKLKWIYPILNALSLGWSADTMYTNFVFVIKSR